MDGNQSKVPTFSVVIPIFNGRKYIRQCLDSVLLQKYSNFEVIVVNDGSTDGGELVVAEYFDERLRLINQANLGVAAARNNGINASKGSYIAFLDCDDRWDEDFLLVIHALTEKYPTAGIYTTGFRMVYSDGYNVEIVVNTKDSHQECLVDDYFFRSTSYQFIHTSGIVVPRHLLVIKGGFLPGAAYAEDLELWARICLDFPIAIEKKCRFSFYQTGTTGKPRFCSSSKMDVKVMLLDGYLRKELNLASSKRQKEILANMKSYFLHQLYGLAWSGTRDQARQYFYGNHGMRYFPFLRAAFASPTAWKLFQLFAVTWRYTRSRYFIRLFGGPLARRGIRVSVVRAKGN